MEKIYKVLAEANFSEVINSTIPSTIDGKMLVEKYNNYIANSLVSCNVINNFIREGALINDDNLKLILNNISNYIQENRFSWSLGSVCEKIKSNQTAHNYLNRNAAKQVEVLLEMNEQDIVKYVKAGALKNVMFCESIRNVVKQVYKNTPMTIKENNFKATIPILLYESFNNRMYFLIEGILCSIGKENDIVVESKKIPLGNEFYLASKLIENSIVENDTIKIELDGVKYNINECIERETKFNKENMDLQTFNENINSYVKFSQLQNRQNAYNNMKSISYICENYENVIIFDNVRIIESDDNKFYIINSSNKYIIIENSKVYEFENIIEVVNILNKNINIDVSSIYENEINEFVNKEEVERKKIIEREVISENITNRKERINMLTEKFKNDPVKLMILSKIAQELGNY